VRILKSGEIRYKPSAYKEETRLNADPLPMTKYLKGEKVQLYSGHGWLTGSVVYSDETRCTVFLSKEQRMVCCVDNRNLTVVKNDSSKKGKSASS
jgi:hypothetical protein